MKKWLFLFFIFLAAYFQKITAQNLYALDSIVKVELFFVEEDWEFPLHYYRSLKKGDRHMGRAIVNGETFDSVGVRFKGFSSYRRKFKKNPMNVKLDYVQKKADYGKYETLKLSNGNLDPSWMREVLAYKIARKYMVAPKSNYAQVFVNNKYYGLFGNTENVDGKFGKRKFNAKESCVVVKGNAPGGPFSGHRSSLQYLGNDSTLYMNAYELDSEYGWTELMELTRILKNEPAKIESILNLDGAIWMLAFNNILINLDSYSDFQQNFYLIQDKNGRFHFVPWDLNLAFDGLGKPAGIIMQHDYNPLAKKEDARFPLINLVLNNSFYRKIYFAHCRTILKENFSNGWYKEEMEKYRALIDNAVQEDVNWIFPYEAFQENYLKTYHAEQPHPFPYPGIIELMEKRIDFLENHVEYKKQAPIVSEISVDFAEGDSTQLYISVDIENANSASIFYRKKVSHVFKEKPLRKEGGAFSTMIPADGKKLQYYILAENKDAVMFSPERASYEYHTLKLEK